MMEAPLLGEPVTPRKAVVLVLAVPSVLVKKLRPGTELPVLTAWQLVAGSFPLLVWSWAVEPATIRWTPHFWGAAAEPRPGGDRPDRPGLVLAAAADGGRQPGARADPDPPARLGFAVLFYGERLPSLVGWGGAADPAGARRLGDPPLPGWARWRACRLVGVGRECSCRARLPWWTPNRGTEVNVMAVAFRHLGWHSLFKARQKDKR